MTNRLEWDLVDGVSEYHILKYDNPNFNESTWDNHIVATVNDNHYEIDDNDINFYVVAYEKDNIIILSRPIVQKLKNDGLICDIRVNYNKSRPHPTVLRDYPYDEFIMDNTGKTTFNFHTNYNSYSTNFISNGKEILCRTEPYTGSCYVEYKNENDFGTNDFVIEFGVATLQSTEWITLCTIGKIQLLIRTSMNEIAVYYNQTTFTYYNHQPSNYDGYHKVKIERSGGIFKFYQNDFLIYTMTDKKSDSLDNKFYIGNKLRNDYQISYCIIDDVFINGKKVVPTNIVGENWQYTNGMMIRGTDSNSDPNFVVRLKEFLNNDFTIIGEVYLHYLNNDPYNRITFIDLQKFGLYINLQQRKLFAYNADTVYNEYIFKPTRENKPVKIAYVRKNGIVYIYVDDMVICSKTVQNTIDEIDCILNSMAIKSLQVYNHSSFFNEGNGMIINHLNNDAIKFTNVILNNDILELSWTDTNGKMVKIFRDGYEIGTSNENKFTVNTIFKNKKQVYHLETDNYKSQEHIVYTHKYNPFYNAIGMDLCNNDGYIWDFRSTNTYAQDNDKTKQKPLYELKPFYENKKGFGILGGNSNGLFNNINGCYHIKPSKPISNFTFETTINPNMFYGREMVLLHIIGTELFKFYQVYMYLDSSNRLAVKVTDERNGIPSAQLIIQGNDILQRNNWYNIVLTRSGSVYTLYLNGKSLGKTTTNAKLGISSVFVGTNCHYRETSNNIYDFVSLTSDVVYNGNYTVSKSLPQLTDNHIFYLDFENGWEDKSNNKYKNLVFNNSYIGYADYSDNWFTSIDRNEFGNFYYHRDSINFDSMSVMIEFDYIPIIDSNFFRNTFSQVTTGSSSGMLGYFGQQYSQSNTSYKKITNCRLKGAILIENRGKTLNFATLYINGVMVKSVQHQSNNINRLLHNVNFFDNGSAGYVSNFRIYTNITPLFEHDYEKGIGFTYNSKVIDYRCSINKNSITINDSNPSNVYNVFDDLGNKILDGVKKGTHTCTIERERYFIIERNSELIFDKWIDFDDEHWDNVVFYHKFGSENDEKFNHPMQSRYPLTFENGVLLARHAVIHTRAFDIGTSNFTIEIELKTSFKTENRETIVTINSTYESTSYGNFALDFNGGLYMADYNGSLNATWNIASNAGANYLSNMEWRSVVIMRKNGVLTYSVDGVEMWRINSTHNIRPHYARNIVLGYNREMVMFRKFRITKSARF